MWTFVHIACPSVTQATPQAYSHKGHSTSGGVSWGSKNKQSSMEGR